MTSSRLSAYASILACLTIVLSCRRRVGNVEIATDYGYIIIGQEVAVAYGLVSGDTLGELAREAVPAPVVAGAEQQALQIEYVPKCARFFRAGSQYLVLLKSRCVMGEVADDGEAIAAFDVDGKPVGRPLLTLTRRAYEALSPGERAVP